MISWDTTVQYIELFLVFRSYRGGQSAIHLWQTTVSQQNKSTKACLEIYLNHVITSEKLPWSTALCLRLERTTFNYVQHCEDDSRTTILIVYVTCVSRNAIVFPLAHLRDFWRAPAGFVCAQREQVWRKNGAVPWWLGPFANRIMW